MNGNMNGKINGNVSHNWRRPPGPPNVWKIVEINDPCKKGSNDCQPIKISIQEIPEDRLDETVDFMCKYFIDDEPMCGSLKIRNDPGAVEDIRSIWKLYASLGNILGAYKTDNKGNITELIGTNMLIVVTDEAEEAFKTVFSNFKSDLTKRFIANAFGIMKKVDVREMFNVDKYISALGLSVAPEYRGQKLGLHLLNARSDIGRKYGIDVTSTIFTAISSQTQAKRAGFEDVYSIDYVDILDENGKQFYPIDKEKSVKIMVKRLP